jgi:GNAT superfamily N-acetyltransferase
MAAVGRAVGGGSGAVLVRVGRAQEAAALSALALRSKAYWGYDEAFMAACRAELTVDAEMMVRRPTLVAVAADGGIVGYAALDGVPPRGELAALFVDPPAIGQGVGRLLYEHAVALARTLGHHTLTIDADPYAEPFYLAMGAVRIGATPSGSIPGRELPLMSVRLAD